MAQRYLIESVQTGIQKKEMNKKQKKALILGSLAIFAIFITSFFFFTDWTEENGKEAEGPEESQPSPSEICSDSFEHLQPKYKVLIHENSIRKIEEYKSELVKNIKISGNSLRSKLKDLFTGKTLDSLTTVQFVDVLLAIKIPQVFSEIQYFSSDACWSSEEARLLGDMSIVMPVKVFDNGKKVAPEVYDTPFDAHLMYTPGAFLLKLCGVDYAEVSVNDEFDDEKFFKLYERRLLPPLRFANDEAGLKGTKAIVTIPEMGVGFVDETISVMIIKFNQILKKLLKKYAAQLPNISLVYYGQRFYPEQPENEVDNIGGIKYMRVSFTAKKYLNFLEYPEKFGKEYKDHVLFAFADGDPLSFPGNFFFDNNARATDEGIKAASTSSMTSLLGVEGEYDKQLMKYLPLSESWNDIAHRTHIKATEGHLHVLKKNPMKLELVE